MAGDDAPAAPEATSGAAAAPGAAPPDASAAAAAATSKPAADKAAAAEGGSPKQKVPDSEVEAVAWCRLYLKAISDVQVKNGKDIIAGLKQSTTLGALRAPPHLFPGSARRPKVFLAAVWHEGRARRARARAHAGTATRAPLSLTTCAPASLARALALAWQARAPLVACGCAASTRA